MTMFAKGGLNIERIKALSKISAFLTSTPMNVIYFTNFSSDRLNFNGVLALNKSMIAAIICYTLFCVVCVIASAYVATHIK